MKKMCQFSSKARSAKMRLHFVSACQTLYGAVKALKGHVIAPLNPASPGENHSFLVIKIFCGHG